MTIGLASWQRLWGELGAATVNGGLLNQLVAAWGEPQRHYHTLQHLRECLSYLEAASMLARRPAEVELALWFHDAVYDPRRDDNEQRSADWARAGVRAAGCAPEVADRVHALVMATRTHAYAGDDPDTRLLLDIDLSILGAAPARFDDYQRQIRAEYAHVPEPLYRERRAQVLRGFLARPRIYLTDAFHDALEARARGNLARA
ncbi:N-methyl-D-aspartate receptor NMDAR2C subunit [Ramlibacter tataouinensis]|uniref:HD domain-containing protein n=1 Tax=Ramlibacter tataouinensis TaxID=94132 RepID=UPI0022F3B24E|nr:N-methyl-D-aspartate receptor NMDAR2C subunit [Ramlibacter tataouinensis]WBY01362.1 N-methyl-D-aspartate receptor NMDAR2C subunit [Ramlibacter tataouinensis]